MPQLLSPHTREATMRSPRTRLSSPQPLQLEENNSRAPVKTQCNRNNFKNTYDQEKLYIKWKSLSHVRLCDSMDCSPQGSSVREILQARILEWVAIFFSRGCSPPRDWTRVSCIAGKFFTIWATREAHSFICGVLKKYLTNIEQFDGCQREEVYEWVKWLKVVKSSNFQL